MLLDFELVDKRLSCRFGTGRFTFPFFMAMDADAVAILATSKLAKESFIDSISLTCEARISSSSSCEILVAALSLLLRRPFCFVIFFILNDPLGGTFLNDPDGGS